MKSDIVWAGDFLDGSAKLAISDEEIKRIRHALATDEPIPYGTVPERPARGRLRETAPKKKPRKKPNVTPEPKKKIHKSGFVF